MAFLIMLGSILALHVPEGWRRRYNQVSGAFVLAAIALLILTAFALYYVGSDTWRITASAIHLLVGFALAPVLVVHIVLGRRAPVRSDSLKHET